MDDKAHVDKHGKKGKKKGEDKSKQEGQLSFGTKESVFGGRRCCCFHLIHFTACGWQNSESLYLSKVYLRDKGALAMGDRIGQGGRNKGGLKVAVLRYALFVAYCGIFFLFIYIASFFVSKKTFSSLARLFCVGSLKCLGVRLEVRGEENLKHPILINEDGNPSGFLCLFSHSSLVDIPAVHLGVGRHVCFAAKKELGRIPIFSRLLKCSGCLLIDRKNKEKMLKIYEGLGVELKKSGQVLALAPEGTRGEGKKLLPFKVGPFVLGYHGKLPLVPVIIFRSRGYVMEKKSRIEGRRKKDREIILQILPPVSMEKAALGEKLDEIKKKVEKDMTEALFLLWKERA